VRRRILVFIVGIGAAALIYSLSGNRIRTSAKLRQPEKADRSDVVQPVSQGEKEIEQLNELFRSDPNKALMFLAKLEKEQSRVPPADYPEAASLTAEDYKKFIAEIEALAPIFKRVEKDSSEILFDGQRKGTFQRSIRVNPLTQEQFDEMANAYSAVLARYPTESDLHTALWKRITQLVNEYSREKLLAVARSESGTWDRIWEIRSTMSGRGVDSVTSGIPDENGRMKFEGPHKLILHSAEEPGGMKALVRYDHLFIP
jgi:hypothetical protein